MKIIPKMGRFLLKWNIQAFILKAIPIMSTQKIVKGIIELLYAFDSNFHKMWLYGRTLKWRISL